MTFPLLPSSTSPASRPRTSPAGGRPRRYTASLVLAVALATVARAQISKPPEPSSGLPLELGKERRAIDRFLTPADTFHRGRFTAASAGTAVFYGTLSTLLWHAWYKDFEQTSLRSKDDSRQWLGMDKAGHFFTTYHYSRCAYSGLQWTGARRGRSIVAAVGTGMLLQTTLEVMDGYSAAWGFSWHDMAANAAGAGLFATQELIWRDQRVNVKFSNRRVAYDDTPLDPVGDTGGPTSSLLRQAERLYGSTPGERLIKDYNGQNLWLGFNPAVLLGKDAKLPWLNIAVGYSAHDMYGPLGDSWREGPFRYQAPADQRRQREYALSLDIDFERLPVRPGLLRTVLTFANMVKVPAPAVLLRERDGLQWRWLYY